MTLILEADPNLDLVTDLDLEADHNLDHEAD